MKFNARLCIILGLLLTLLPTMQARKKRVKKLVGKSLALKHKKPLRPRKKIARPAPPPPGTILMKTSAPSAAQLAYQTKTDQYNATFDNLTMPEQGNYATQTAYSNALASYKSNLSTAFNAFKIAAEAYAQELTITQNSFANVIKAHIAYEQALFTLVTINTLTTKPADLEALQNNWDTQTTAYIQLLFDFNDTAKARDIAFEVYDDLAYLYYYYQPQLYTDKLMAKQVAIKYYGENMARSYYPDLFK